jgi:CFEM domain
MPTRILVVPWFMLQAVAAQNIWACPAGNCGIQNQQGVAILDGCAASCAVYAATSAAGCSLVDCICNPGHFSFAVSSASQCAALSCTLAFGDVASVTNVINSFCGTWSATAAPALTQAPVSVSVTAHTVGASPGATNPGNSALPTVTVTDTASATGASLG